MFLYIIYRIAQAIVFIFPVKFSYWLGSRIADIHYYTSKKDRNLVVNNLKEIFGKDDKRTRVMARAVLRNFAKYLVEFLRFSKMGKDYIEKYLKIEGLDNLKHALDANKGAITFSAHLGNWEWGAAVVAQLGLPINVIALAHKDKNVNNFFINQRRIKGVKNIPLGGSVRTSLKLLAKNEIIAILSDRDFSNNSLSINFFGKPSLMPVGIGLFAIKARCAIVPTFIIRQKDDTHKLIFEKSIDYNISGDKEKDIKEVVQKAASVIERYVRLYPEQWFIFDNPWKSK